MEPRKLTKADIDSVRHIEGFPDGRDEDIIALSDAPYYTACPNPFIAEFIAENGTPYDEGSDSYHCEPFAADVSEGKNDPIYTAHSYHTKVPHRAIMRYVEHYTKPGDLIFDGFSGTGMTGVAAEKVGETIGLFDDTAGHRNAIVCDLSPAATYISSRYNMPQDSAAYKHAAEQIIAKLRDHCKWMFRTRHTGGNANSFLETDGYGEIDYTVWSDVFICPNCGNEIVYWDVAVDFEKHTVEDNFNIANKEYGIILMSVRPNAPYADRFEDNGTTIIYEGHDVQKNFAPNGADPKTIDQPMTIPSGSLCENGKFFTAAKEYQAGKPVKLIKVYEKINSGIWVYNGFFRLTDSWIEPSNGRNVFKFRLEMIDDDISAAGTETVPTELELEHNRLIPTSVKVEVWKRDKGCCVYCGSKTNLHYDHIIPFSKGGSSTTAANIQLLCATCNLRKHDNIE